MKVNKKCKCIFEFILSFSLKMFIHNLLNTRRKTACSYKKKKQNISQCVCNKNTKNQDVVYDNAFDNVYDKAGQVN